MSQMRAVLIRDGKGPAENLYIGEAPKPTPNANQVLVKVRAGRCGSHPLMYLSSHFNLYTARISPWSHHPLC